MRSNSGPILYPDSIQVRFCELFADDLSFALGRGAVETSSAEGKGGNGISFFQLLFPRSENVDWYAATSLTLSLTRIESADSEFGQGAFRSAEASIDESAYFKGLTGSCIADEISNSQAPFGVFSHA